MAGTLRRDLKRNPRTEVVSLFGDTKIRALLDEIYNHFATYTVPIDFEAWHKVRKRIRAA